MRHWIIMLRPETYAVAQQNGQIGVLHQHRKRFSAMAPGDRFVTYVSRQRVLDGHGEMTSEPFIDVEPIGAGWARYPHRCRVRFDQVGKQVDAKKLLWGFSPFDETMKTSPANLMFCKGGFMEITAEDYRWARGVLDGDREAAVTALPGE